MKILLVVANFIPEIGSAAHIYYDLALAFVRRGHEVHILTTYPREYNLVKSDQNKVWKLDETLDGVHVHRVDYEVDRNNIIKRGLEHFLIPGKYFKRYKKLGIKFDATLMYIPPLPIYYLAKKIKRYDGTKSILNFQDFHPQELTDVGVMKNPLYIKVMEHIERQAYRNADHITVLTKGGVDYVVNRGADPKKVTHIYNAVNLEEMKQYAKKKNFKKKQGIEDKFLVSYAGILSPYQGIDNILNAARFIKDQDNDDIIFYIVGDGIVKEHLEQRIKSEYLSNVCMMPFQERNEYFNIVNSSDVCIVSLDERMKAPCLPGKIMNLLAMGKPTIASVSDDTEIAKVVEEVGGVITTPYDLEDFSQAIKKVVNDSHQSKIMEKNGPQFILKNMNIDENVLTYEEIIKIIT